MKRLTAAIAISLGGFAFLLSYFYGWEGKKIDPVQESSDYEVVALLIQEGKPEKAIKVMSPYLPEIDELTPLGKKWAKLLIDATHKMQNAPQMALIYMHSPDLFDSDEHASILAAEGLLKEEKGEDFGQLRAKWKGKESILAPWVLLDVQKLLADKNVKDAEAKLKKFPFEGKWEVKRLLMLSFLAAPQSPKDSWNYLEAAQIKDPTNPQIFLYKAKLLEAANKPKLALKEFFSAISASKENDFAKDELGNFYLRQGRADLALQVWQSLLTHNENDALWIKAWFWNKIAQTIPFNWKSRLPPQGTLSPYLSYLISLAPDQFWDDVSFETLADDARYIKELQSTFWLRLLSALKNERFEEAEKLLRHNPFKQESWNLKLEKTLSMLLSLQENQHSPLKEEGQTNQLSSKENYFALVQEAFHFPESKQNEKFLALIQSHNAFSAAFLAAGWDRAALILHGDFPVADDLPSWYAYALTQAWKNNEGNEKAIDFATKQPPSKELNLLIGEMSSELGLKEKALTYFFLAAKEPSPLAEKAAWYASSLLIEEKKYLEALDFISRQKTFKESVLGQELQAQIALLQGNDLMAAQIYEGIVKDSEEAKSYLAKKAYEEKNYSLAKQLTSELLSVYPDNTLLIENLKNIEQSEKDAT